MAIEIKEIGVIGAGQMGGGISHVFTLAGYKIHLCDIDEAALEKAMGAIDRNMSRQVARKKITDDQKNDALALISTGTDFAPLSNCDLIIEAASEDEAVKKEVLKNLGPVLKPDAIVASNTSSISITRLGATMERPENFMGMHFMNPVPMMELVELIRGIATDPKTFDIIRDLTRKLGKTPVSSEDFPAFLVNRILLPMINEAVYTLYEGVGSVSAIDTAMKLGTNHPMGPLELADFIGLDICLAVMNVLHEGLADTKYRPCPLLVKYVEAGWLGRKTGRGFYDYAGETPVPTR
ncbi:MAG: 3-hydroxybutyryl-CoA dehydrogenase [Rhodospirillaceae bacterium]|jgi:3-hydroxybutyryl-CoA dehydrogenase|nr:3-hydroxybutyryl-CoA dehydrogenase [Rhodospirillaceae bacterium]MBT8004133.1 3-hydroxybutyryl-CoA dehydrogenase [Rhodospirillales bacterium]MBT4701906.1 3-hydroxybutyryl-CoA dehydrogenase [Rhodospirillaceae bacterium]MBT5034738.1 3-hydroxybutyryl-CoA dehydrogenase [Rhodospirillaceae bacterium]MBT6221461.1 3-hydroxybutyryl-CoA dehydrogenase [Rhodospirillaceae bacterium]